MARLWANAILKFNRSQLKKRNIRELKDLLRENSGKTVKEFKKVSPVELKRIKAQIRHDAKVALKREIILYAIAFILIALFSWLVIALL